MKLFRAGAAAVAVLFFWGAFSHLVLIKGVGFSAIPDEERSLAGLEALPPGLYVFPAIADPTPEWEARFLRGPSGLLTVRPRGEGAFSVARLGVQLLADVIAVALALMVVRLVAGSFLRRMASVMAVGVSGLATISVISWNWYAFTAAFFAAQCLDVVGGWLLVGATLAVLTPSAPARSSSLSEG